MYLIRIAIQFKKDLKQYKKQPQVTEKLEFILGLLQNELPIPEENQPHPLTGNYRGHMECHVENDTPMIWWDKESDMIKPVRFGTNS